MKRRARRAPSADSLTWTKEDRQAIQQSRFNAQSSRYQRETAIVEWWMRQSDEARDAAFSKDAAPIWRVLVDFSNWLAAHGAKYPWCHGAGFDAPLLEAAYKACGLIAPWKFQNVRDTRTLYDLAGVKVDRRPGTHHHALDDAINQAEAAARALRIVHVNKVVSEAKP